MEEATARVKGEAMFTILEVVKLRLNEGVVRRDRSIRRGLVAGAWCCAELKLV